MMNEHKLKRIIDLENKIIEYKDKAREIANCEDLNYDEKNLAFCNMMELVIMLECELSIIKSQKKI